MENYASEESKMTSLLFWLLKRITYYGIVLEENKNNIPEANIMFK